MSISKHILEEAHLALLDNGQIALCDNTKAGTLRVHRVITRDEVINLILTFYAQFRRDNPELQVVQIPYRENTMLAIAEIPVPNKK